jgi:asparagine synthase (glutamine-hydrolysing)
MGFAMPIHGWLRHELRDWAEALLDERRLAREGIFNPGPIRARWREHLDQTQNWDSQLWVVLMFQAWKERWLA